MESTQGLEAWGRLSVGTFTVTANDDLVDATIIGFDQPDLGAPRTISAGRMPSADGEVVASEDDRAKGFDLGDTVRVGVKVVEGNRERVQAFEGVCIARRNAGLNSSFTVRKISYGEGVERVFPLYSPRIESIELIRKGDVRRAKLYYLRDRRGKSARITERTTGRGMNKDAAE